MKALLIALICVLTILCGQGNTACVHTSANVWTATPDHVSVQSCVTQAARGDVVNVSAGSATWTSSVDVTKSITLQGAGAGSTIISAGWVPANANGLATGETLIFIQPATIASDTDVLMRVTGFTFVLTNGSYHTGGILVNNFSNTPLNKLRVDNNTFTNAYWNGSNNAYCAVGAAYSTVYGVVDNNTFTGEPHLYLKGRDRTSWDNRTWTYGTAQSMYFEDNTFTNITDFPNNNGGGASAVYRYNTFTLGANYYDFAIGNSHGNDTNTGSWSSFGSEVYGNLVTPYAGDTSLRFGNQRGGRNVMFYNRVLTGSWIDVQEYEGTGGAYGYDYGSETNTVCPPGTLYANGSRTGCATDGMPQHVTQTYMWNNRQGASGVGTIMSVGNLNPTTPTLKLRQNIDFFSDNFGSTYMGCGALAARPATCSTGAGYWATDQSCANTTNMVGVNPTTPISGTLYRCYPTDKWTAHYTPYTYPHPLRTEEDPPSTAPTMSGMSPSAEQTCTDETDPYIQDVSISLQTNIDATCKWGVNNAKYCEDATQTGADLICEVPDGTAGGTAGWTQQETNTGVVDLAYACDNTAALGCSDIDMSYCFRTTQTSVAGDGDDLYAFKLLSADGLTGHIYLQAYIKVLTDSTESDGSTPMAYNHDIEIIGLSPGSMPGTYDASVFVGLTGGYTGSTSHRPSLSLFYLASVDNVAETCTFVENGDNDFYLCEHEGTTTIAVDGTTWIPVRFHINQTANAQGDTVEFWVDWNNDGDFDDLGESFSDTGVTLWQPLKYVYVGQNTLDRLFDVQTTGIKVSNVAMPSDCRRATYSTSTAYADLPSTFTGAGTQSHSATATSIPCDSTATIFYACQDSVPNVSDTGSWSFNIAAGDDTDEAVITQIGSKSQGCSTTQRIVVTTDKQSTCKWDTSDKTYANMANTFTTTVDTTHHEVSVNQACSSTVTRYIRCSTTQGVASTSSTSFVITTDAAKTVNLTGGTKTLGVSGGSLTVQIIQ